MPGYEMSGGLILAMGDIGIVLFSMLFPDGKFVPRWMKFIAPLLVITMLGIYIFPNAPFFWNTMGRSGYLLATTTWYVIGLSPRFTDMFTMPHWRKNSRSAGRLSARWDPFCGS